MLAHDMRDRVALIPAFQSSLALFDKMCDCVTYPASALMPQLIGLVDAVRRGVNQISHLIHKETKTEEH